MSFTFNITFALFVCLRVCFCVLWLNVLLLYFFIHKTSSPTFPQSNKMAEKLLQTAQWLLKKAKMDDRDLTNVILSLSVLTKQNIHPV